MIEISNIEVFNFEGAFRGMRNPLNSWKKSDSDFKNDIIGVKDLRLAQNLITAGTDHSKFMRQIMVSMDIKAPLYWWKEMSTYKIATVANSTSTMHKLASTEITEDCFSLDEGNDVLVVSDNCCVREVVKDMVDVLENLRQRYNKTGSQSYWRALIQLLPESWLQTRTWTANYAVLRNIYFSRKNHKLNEWHTFCQMIENLPYGKELICYTKESKNE